MVNLILPYIEKIINKLLTTDNRTKEKLGDLTGKVLMLHITTLSLTIYLTIQNNKFKLSTAAAEEPTTKVSGQLSEFIKLLTQIDQDLPDSHLQIEGNLHLLQKFRNILVQWDIDWEEHLSYYVGDVMAHQASRFINKALTYESETRQSMTNNLREYLHTETQHFPEQDELNQFYQQVDRLRCDVDRITQRVARLRGAL